MARYEIQVKGRATYILGSARQTRQVLRELRAEGVPVSAIATNFNPVFLDDYEADEARGINPKVGWSLSAHLGHKPKPMIKRRVPAKARRTGRDMGGDIVRDRRGQHVRL